LLLNKYKKLGFIDLPYDSTSAGNTEHL